MLEKKSAELTWDPTWVFMTLLEIGIPFPVLHGIYDRLFKAKVNKDMSYVLRDMCYYDQTCNWDDWWRHNVIQYYIKYIVELSWPICTADHWDVVG